MDEEKIKIAILEACRKAGGQVAFAKSKGIGQGWVADYLSGRKKIRNMTLSTLYKLFPDLDMTFFITEQHKDDLLIDLQRRVLELEKNQKNEEKNDITFSRNSNGVTSYLESTEF